MKFNRKKNVYAEISKVEAQDDGTLKVWGYASTPNQDEDGETITAECMKNALPDYMKFGAVREMHQPSAAGTAIEASVDAEGRTWFGAHVVDPVAVKKVETGVYKGFSVAGKVTKRDPLNKAIIQGLKLVEVSLVDRPCNPEAAITIAKAASTPEEDVEELAALLDEGVVTPGQLITFAKGLGTTPTAPTEGVTGDDAAKAAEGTGHTDTSPLTGGEVPGVTGDPLEPSADDAAKAASTEEPALTTEQVELLRKVFADPVLSKSITAPDHIKKGMYSISRFSEMLSALAYLCTDCQYEADLEADNSPVPTKLRKWMKDGIGIFKEMAIEEADELLAGLTTAKAAKVDLKKSAATDTDGIAETEDLVAKAVAPLNAQIEALTKENNELKKAPAPGKAFLMAVSKAADVSGEAAPTDNAPAEGTPERALYETRKALGLSVRLAG